MRPDAAAELPNDGLEARCAAAEEAKKQTLRIVDTIVQDRETQQMFHALAMAGNAGDVAAARAVAPTPRIASASSCNRSRAST